MECEEITQTQAALEVMQKQEKKHLQQKLFNCIYKLFHSSFLQWILLKYNYTPHKQKLYEDAKDAFQNGLTAFYIKSQQQEFRINGSLKTTIYSFGLLQLLAYFKKDKMVYGVSDYMKCFELFIEDPFFENERNALLNERENKLIDSLSDLPNKQREIVLMKFFHKLKSKQIAEMLHVTAGNIDNESTKAYKQLKNKLESKLNLTNEIQ